MDTRWSSRGRPRRRCREFADDDLERALLIKALHTKGLPLSLLARENLAFEGQFVIFDGRTLCAYPDAAAAIAAAGRLKRCSVLDLSAIRAGAAAC